MSWLATVFFPCAQPRKQSKEPTYASSSSRVNEQQQRHQNVPLSIDPSLLPQRPHKLARKPLPQRASVRIVDYPKMLGSITEEKETTQPTTPTTSTWNTAAAAAATAATETASFLSDDRTIHIPDPDNEALLVEMGKIEKEMAAKAPQPPTVTMRPRPGSFSAPRPTSRRTSLVTTTRTSACLDMPPTDWGRITRAIHEEKEGSGKEKEPGVAITTDEIKSSKKIETVGAEDSEQQDNQRLLEKEREQQQKEGQKEGSDAVQEVQQQQEQQEQEQQKEEEEEEQECAMPTPRPTPEPKPEPSKKEQNQHHQHHLSTISSLSTRLSRRRSLIEIFNILQTNERSSFKLRLDFSPRLRPSPSSPTCSSTTAASSPMSPVSSILPLSPTLSDETIMIDSIETACVVPMYAGGRKSPEVATSQGTTDALGLRL